MNKKGKRKVGEWRKKIKEIEKECKKKDKRKERNKE